VYLLAPAGQSRAMGWPRFAACSRSRAVLYLSILFLHFIGLALGVGTSFAMLTLGAAARDLAPEDRSKFMMRVSALRKNGSYGLGLLILSGIAMLLLRGPAAVFAWGGGAFHLKLTLVVILIGFFGYMQVLTKKIRLAGGGPLMAKLPKLSLIMLGLSVAIVASAVAAFK
jgi:uncharacterized membrane protein